MLKTLDEVKKVEISVDGVINGVDNANLMSVDSTTPIKTATDELEEEKETTTVDGEKEDKTAEKKEEKETTETTAVAEGETKEEKKEEEKVIIPNETKNSDPIEKRIGKLTKKFRSAERDRDYQRTKRLAAEEELRKLKRTIPTEGKPVAEDFEDTSDYLEALTDWKVKEALRVQQIDVSTETDEAKDKQVIDDIEEEIESIANRGRDKYEDYDTLVFDKNLILTENMIEAILLSEIADEILYHLGQHPDKAAMFGELSAIKVAREIGKLEVELEADIPKPNASSEGGVLTPDGKTVIVTPKKKKITKTPEPIVPVKATGVTEKDPSDMSPKEYRVWRESKKE